MNLFKFVELNGSSKGYLGKPFFISDKEKINCIECGAEIKKQNRMTCGDKCKKEHRKNERLFKKDGKQLSKTELMLLIQKKYA